MSSALKAGRPSRQKEKLMDAVKGGAQQMIKMNVNIPKALHKKVKQKALDEDTTVTELVIDMLTKLVSNELPEVIPEILILLLKSAVLL